MDIPNSDTYEGNTYSVKSLGNFCSVCCSLTSIAIPESVTSLGNSCFQGCSSQKSVTCELSKPIENGGLFYNTPISNAVFHVPASGSSSAKLSACLSTMTQSPKSCFSKVKTQKRPPKLLFTTSTVCRRAVLAKVGISSTERRF